MAATDQLFGAAQKPLDPNNPNQRGHLVRPDDIDELTKAMVYYIDNLKIERGFSVYRKTFMNRYDVSTVVKVHAAALLTAAGKSSTDNAVKSETD